MVIASNATNDEDILIACLMHDVLEDVSSNIYSEAAMRADYGDRVVSIVLDVTKNDALTDWHERSKDYLDHLENKACDEAVIVSASDKIHNLLSVLADFDSFGDDVWNRFKTNSSADQLWWYQSILAVIRKRKVPALLSAALAKQVAPLQARPTV